MSWKTQFHNTEKYTLVKSATVYTPSSPSYDGTGVNAKLQGTWTLRNYDATYVITDNIDGDGSGLNSKYIILTCRIAFLNDFDFLNCFS